MDFFVKSGGMSAYEMLSAEYEGVSEIFESNTINVPRPITKGSSSYISYAVFERVSLGGRADPAVYAERLVSMLKCLSPNGLYGWKRNNTIGMTFQPNNYCDSWAEFWDKYRLGHMLSLARVDGAVFLQEDKLREKTKAILSQHQCSPSLVHGDLWSGNQGATTDGEPVIFDPAVYVSSLLQFQ